MGAAIEPIHYSIWDPAGNITALVESPVEVSRQLFTASALMQRHPEVEQVGFVCFDDADQPEFSGPQFSVCQLELSFQMRIDGNIPVPYTRQALLLTTRP